MKRPYKSTDVVDRLRNVKKKCPSLRLGTHIITGLPTVTAADFDATLELLDNIDFDFMGVFVYSEHQNAKSAGITGKVDPNIAKQRASRIADQFGERVKIFG
jgi:tRNA A37 methylthiotransferase MiaB